MGMENRQNAFFRRKLVKKLRRKMLLKDLQVICGSRKELRPLWKEVVLAACALLVALSWKINDVVDHGRVQTKTAGAVDEKRRAYSKKCAALIAELDLQGIEHPPDLRVFDVGELFL
jgi:hypothetical protein